MLHEFEQALLRDLVLVVHIVDGEAESLPLLLFVHPVLNGLVEVGDKDTSDEVPEDVFDLIDN